jgi:putative ABC transport system ATP-binding protein
MLEALNAKASAGADQDPGMKKRSNHPMLISMTQVTKTYTMGETAVQAVNGVDLAIEKGEFISIWGPSGSGKTTLLNLMGAIDEPSSGQIEVDGHDLSQLSDNKSSELRNRFIGFIFQRYNLIPVLSAVENVMIPLQIQGVSSVTARQKALARLDIVGLTAVAHHRPDKMSGGQQQRVAVARALITDPPLVIADEPTANLDSDTAMQLIALMRDINQGQGTTFVFSTHDQRLLDHVQRRIRLKDGRIQLPQEEVA